ncbi:hypothetical protein E6Q11_04335 [Candidatus Dojkabacteria bacterium]|uniref:Uncharacterized protein n=1 Tax=Candidatus Dojkabacteria bacterium TaxID=2099670 RepID=A0A5C7J4Z2_9BACT|nr:MAG: hypothetical protein E6Q11_04335 [Candidatus Dojkabacteria bacterium]
MLKRYVIRKYIFAKSAQQALKREKHIKADDVWIDDEWKRDKAFEGSSDIGFKVKKVKICKKKK